MEAPTLGRGCVYPLDNYRKGAQVWVRHPELVWVSGTLLQDISYASEVVQIKIHPQDGDDECLLNYQLNAVGDNLPYLRNPDILDGKDDLTAMTFLHEPAVLHNLKLRFVKQNDIYTYCGIVLVAINPYCDCADMYGDDVIQLYRDVNRQEGRVRIRDLRPHIYGVAEEAFHDLSEFGKSQSIIVSGESGAGKTVSAKFVMRYLASISTKKGSIGVEDRVLASNPLMEAIGNAKTVRNDNSSRFGKYIQINFGDRFAINGAEMKTYLLEKSRLVFQTRNERNYHIFYQMLQSRHHPILQDFELESCNFYHYANQGGDITIPGVNDAADFMETLKAMEQLGFSPEELTAVFRVLAGILTLGNIDFLDEECSSNVMDASDAQLDRLSTQFLNVSKSELRKWLTTREIKAGGDKPILKGLTRYEAIRSRDALAKLMYAKLFCYLVDRVNEALRGVPSLKAVKDKNRFVGVLDIYGFETFDVNSFEQFCINYANEKLQQQFNQHVFKLEQEEYEREELAWVRIEFYDNQPAIDLIEGNPGLISYLDDICTVHHGTDDGWLNRINSCQELKKNKQLDFPRTRSKNFIVKHFASEVCYTIHGFMEKNKDAISEQLLKVVMNSEFSLLRDMLSSGSDGPVGGKLKKTVATKFRNSLKDLMTVLCSTRPHYVRCIKPNDYKESFMFDPKRAIQQLRACGVLETVRISAEGFPSRWTFEEFSRTYRVLYLEGINGRSLWRDSPREFTERACAKHLKKDKYAVGKTKIFFRTGQLAILERLRMQTRSQAATTIQTAFRGYQARRLKQKMLDSVYAIQASCRAFLAYRRIKYLQMHRAAVTIQTAVRAFLARKRFLLILRTLITIQAQYRATRVRDAFNKMRFEKSVLIIQKHWRGYCVRREQLQWKKKVILVQSCVRRWLARRRLRELKIEARSVGHLQKLNSGLENKIIELQMKLDVLTSQRNSLQEQNLKMTATKAEISVLQSERNELLLVKQHAEELESEVSQLMYDCTLKDAENDGLRSKNVELESRLSTAITDSGMQVAQLQSALEEATVKSNSLEAELLKTKKEVERERLLRIEAEKEVEMMRDRLLANANILASPAFSRVGSVRGDNAGSVENSLVNSFDSPDGSGPLKDFELLARQQTLIADMRIKMEQQQRLVELQQINEFRPIMECIEKKTSMRMFEVQRLQDLETAYEKLKNLTDQIVWEKINLGLENVNFQALIEKLLEDNDRLRDEATELRAILSSRYDRQSCTSSSPRPDSGHCSENSDDGLTDIDEELALERTCRQLKSFAQHLEKLLTDRNKDIEKLEGLQQNEINQFIRPSDCSVEEAVKNVHGVVQRLTRENMYLTDKLIRRNDELTDARAQLRGFAGGMGFSLDQASDSEVVRLESLAKEGVAHSALLEVFNVPEFSRILLYDLKPRLARLLTKCFPAYLLLAAFRFHDRGKDEPALTGLFSTIHAMLKDTISRTSDLDVLSVWLVNTWRLLNLLRQYSGEGAQDEWCAANTEKQNSQRMQSFDLSPIREQLQTRVEDCYQVMMKRAIEPILNPKIVPGVLLNESSSGIIPTGGKSDLNRPSGRDGTRNGLDDLLDFLSFIHSKLSVYGADQALLSQVFCQMARWICALSLNHLMFRKELCNFEKAIQIKHNVTEIQSWFNKKGLGNHVDLLEPLVQACHLLQSRKDESNLETLCGEMTSKLKPRQVVAILQYYSPGQDFEERPIDSDFLILINKKIAEREKAKGLSDVELNELLLPGTYIAKFDCSPFIYSDFQLETLSLPSCLHLQPVCRLL